jgi:hypothetical protein
MVGTISLGGDVGELFGGDVGELFGGVGELGGGVGEDFGSTIGVGAMFSFAFSRAASCCFRF